MAAPQYGIVSAADSEIHDEPHLLESRITVRDIQQRVAERGDAPARVAERFDIDIAKVYQALAYYHANPEEIKAAEARHDRAVEAATDRSTLAPPE